MKANEFVKKFGWGEAKEAIKNVAWCETAYCTRLGHGCFKTKSDCCIDINDLKRLVASHELVEKDFDSVEIAEYEYMISGCYSDPYWVRIKQAIADVESCYD